MRGRMKAYKKGAEAEDVIGMGCTLYTVLQYPKFSTSAPPRSASPLDHL